MSVRIDLEELLLYLVGAFDDDDDDDDERSSGRCRVCRQMRATC